MASAGNAYLFCSVLRRLATAEHGGAEAALAQPLGDRRTEQAIAFVQGGDPRVEIGVEWGCALRRPIRHRRGTAQQQRYRDADRQRVAVRAGPRQGADRPVQPAAGQAMVGAALHTVLRFEVAAHTIGAGNGMHCQRLAVPIHPMQIGKRRMQPVKAAEVEHALVLARFGWNDLAAQSGERRVAVRDDRGQPIQGAAQDHDHEAPVGRRIRQCQRNAPQREG